MFKLFVLALAATALIEAKPHRHFRNRPRIIGGSPAEQGQFPFSASLQFPEFPEPEFHFCGAVIINEQWLLTAGHCLAGQDPEGIVVYVGSAFLDNGGQYYNVEKITFHPDLDPWYFRNDIGVLKLTEPIKFTDDIQPINLPTDITVNPGDKATATGWGTTQLSSEDYETSTNQLHFLESTIADTKYCSEAFDFDILDGQICFGGNGDAGHGMCLGDYGSPLVFNANNKSYAIGISSWGDICALGDPDVYTRVSYYVPWIQEQLSK